MTNKTVKQTKYPVPTRNRKGTRTGYTTGSNASAAAKAATIAFLTGGWPAQVEISLPLGETATMTPVECELTEQSAACCMVKDAGDDPDVTHGALICATVSHTDAPGLTLEGGPGVGRVTLPGLGLTVGGPAINPVPRQQISQNVEAGVQEALPNQADYLEQHGLNVVISVPEGKEIAKKTLNARLGIIDGISILGTTGKVFPYSTAAWRASVIQAVEVAAKNSSGKVVMATGGRSERFAMQIYPNLPEVAFVELSVFTGDALKTCVAHNVRAAVFVGMMGKMVKTAQGHMTTHVAGNQVDFAFLAQVCQEVEAPAGLVEAVAQANTGRHFLELCQEWGCMAPVDRVTALAWQQCQAFVQNSDFGQNNGGDMALETILVDFDGTVLARHQSKQTGPTGSTATSTDNPPETLIERLSADPAHSYDDEAMTGQPPKQGRVGNRTWPQEMARRKAKEAAKQRRSK